MLSSAGRFTAMSAKAEKPFLAVFLRQLEAFFEAGAEVNPETLREKKLLTKGTHAIKILANGEISKALTVKADKFSAAAVAKIEAAGGKVETL